MADWGLTLVAKVLEDKNVRLPIQKGIDEDIFKGNSNLLAKEMYKYILNHYEKYGEVPSREVTQQKFKDYEHFAPEDSLKVICDEFIDVSRRTSINHSLGKIRASNSLDSKQALSKFQEELTTLLDNYKQPDDDFDLKENKDKLIEEYEYLFKEGDGIVGIPYPWGSLNRVSRGLQPEHLVVLYGTAKSGKSWILLVIATYMYIQQKKNILIITREMGKQEIARRCAAIAAQIPFKDFLAGILTPENERNFYEAMEKFEKNDNYMKISTGLNDAGKANVSTIEQKIKKYKPDVVFIDASYGLDDIRTKSKSTEYTVITNITQDLKALALKVKVPFVITTQANRYGDSTTKDGAMAFSASYLRDADLIVRLLRNAKTKKLMMKIDGAREGEEEMFIINSQFSNDFSEDNTTEKNLSTFVKEDKKGIASLYEEENKKENSNNQPVTFQDRFNMNDGLKVND